MTHHDTDAPSLPAAAAKPSCENRTRAEQFRLVMEDRFDLPANLLAAIVTALALGRLYPGWVGALWLCALLLVTVVRLDLRRRYRRGTSRTRRAPAWASILVVSFGATGLLWGLTGSVLLVTDDHIYHLFVVFMLCGLMAGGLIANAPYPPALYALLAPIMAPMIVILLVSRQPDHVEMSVMLTMFALALGLSGRDVGKTLIENLRIRTEKERVANRLAASTADMASTQSIAHLGSWQFDPATNLAEWSKELFVVLGLDPATTLPSREAAAAATHPDDRARVDAFYAGWGSPGTALTFDHRLVMGDGAVKWVHEVVRPDRADRIGLPPRLAGTMQDITRHKANVDRLNFANSTMTALMDASPAGVLIVDAAGMIISHNRRLSEITDVPAAEMEGHDYGRVMAKAASGVTVPPDFADHISHYLAQPETAGREELRTADGDIVDLFTEPLRTAAGDTLGRIWFLNDVTKRKTAEALALRMARFDPLTGLANRGVFVEAAARDIAAAKRTGTALAILFMDLDRFKDVNDTLGHPIGDDLLKAVADRLRSTTGPWGAIARFGGDEFALIATDFAQLTDLAALADGLVRALAEPFTIKGNLIYSGASIGVDLYGPLAPDAETLLSHADVALYRAKAEGRSQFRFFTPEMDATVRARVALAAQLQQALVAGQLFLMYQPQVDVRTGAVTGVEALPRWRHPTRGVLGPESFASVADDMGLAVRLGHWALRTACLEALAWRRADGGPLRVCVGVSAAQFRAPADLEADVAGILRETGLPPERLELELSEDVLMQAAHQDHDVLPRLRKAGVSLAIDRFGTGRSSLGYLRRFPADRIKVAETFVRQLDRTPGDASIVKATIGLARDLGIAVIAVGVERPAQIALLRQWGCGEAAGSLLMKPLAAEAVQGLLEGDGRIDIAPVAA